MASFLFADPGDGAKRFFGVAIAVYAHAFAVPPTSGSHGAWRRTARPRWLLYAGRDRHRDGAAILFGPNHGRGMVRLLLALYLGLTGATTVAYVVALRRDAKRRVRDLLAASGS